MRVCMIEVCGPDDRGSIGAFYIEHHAGLTGYPVERVVRTSKDFDVELVSVHHCNDLPRLAKLPKRAKIRIVGGHAMQVNPRPAVPFADIICIGEGESWIKRALPLLDQTGIPQSLHGIPGTIVTSEWSSGNPLPAPNVERPLPGNPPYLNRPGTRSAAWYVEIARGCPFACSYCELGHSVPYRRYQVDYLHKLIDEIDIGTTRKINFYAPDEASHPNYIELYNHLYHNGFSAGFASMRVDSVMKKMPPLKKNMLVRVGVDGLTEATRKRVRKPISNRQIFDYFRTWADRGHVQFKMFMIFGYPWETIDDFREWERLMSSVLSIPLKKNVSLRIKWTPFIPQPTTPLGKATARYDRDLVDKINIWHAVNDNPRFDPGWYVRSDGLMSERSHFRQCQLVSGDEQVLTLVSTRLDR